MPGKHLEASDLLFAAWEGRTSTVKALVDAGLDVNVKTEDEETSSVTALMFAAMKGYERTVRILLEKGADVNAKDKKGYTALRFAQELHYHKIIDILQDAGARG